MKQKSSTGPVVDTPSTAMETGSNESKTTEDLPTSELFEETSTLRAIHLWVSKRVHDSPISRNTEAFNYLMKQLPELASMIDKENKA